EEDPRVPAVAQGDRPEEVAQDGPDARPGGERRRPVGSLPPSEPPPARHRPGARSARREGPPSSSQTIPAKETTGKPRTHLRIESLEDRSTPSTFAAFDLGSPDGGPFPSDRFTVADASQLTNRRVDLPLPDAASRPSDYADLGVINTLDGFNLQPRLSIPFSGPIDVTTVNSGTVFLIKLADPTSPA